MAGMQSPPRPIGIQLAEATTEALRESQTSGGTEFSDLCAGGQVLIGVQGSTADPADVVRSVQGICGALSVVESPTPGKYEVKITQSSLLPERGPTDSLKQTAMCPADQLLIGFNGRAGGLIDALEFRCASLDIVGASPDFVLVLRTEGDAGLLGGPGGAGFSYAECSSERIAVGQSTRMAEAATAYGFHCAAAALLVE
jgi:hypothetical protein